MFSEPEKIKLPFIFKSKIETMRIIEKDLEAAKERLKEWKKELI